LGIIPTHNRAGTRPGLVEKPALKVGETGGTRLVSKEINRVSRRMSV